MHIQYDTLEIELDPEVLRHEAGGTEFKLAAPEKPLILVPVELQENARFQFAVDTGASTTVISRTTAAVAGLAEESFIPPITGAGGTVSAQATTLPSIRVGQKTCTNLTAAIVDFLPQLSSIIGAQIDGILGHNFLQGFGSILIHYQKKWIRLGK